MKDGDRLYKDYVNHARSAGDDPTKIISDAKRSQISCKTPFNAYSGASFLQFSKLKKFSPRKRRGRAGERSFRPAGVCVATNQ